MKKTLHKLKIPALLAVLLAVCLAVVACVPAVVTSSDLYGNLNYTNTVLNKDKVTTVDIEIAEEDWAAILENPTAEEYYTANVVVNGTRVDNVAIRTKGNNSLTTVANDADSDRYSFKIDFDQYEDQSLYGLKKLCLNNCYNDPSYMREYVSYCLMEEMGVPTPAFAYTWITVNGEDWGLYLGVEAVEETFLTQNFADSAGDLYKPDGTDLSFSSEEIDRYTEALALKTNENSSDYSSISALLDTINGDVSSLAEVLDVDEAVRYFAANTALVSLDSYQGQTLHNYYLYEEDGVFSIIPWDYDLSFGAFGGGGGRMGGAPAGIAADNGAADTATGGEQNVAGEGSVPQGSAPGAAAAPDANATPPELPDGTVPQAPPDGGDMPGGDMPIGAPAQPEAGTQAASTPPGGTAAAPDTATATTGAEGTGVSNAGGNTGAPAATGGDGQMPGAQDFPGAHGGMGGGGGMSSINLNDDTINFPIDTPVSGYNVADYPLIYSWLQQEEYQTLYHEYLAEIANGFFSTSRIQKLVAETMDMISKYVEADPNKVYTTDAFTAGAQDIIDFCTLRGDSIQKQLDGEVDSVLEATSTGTGMGGGMGFGGDDAGSPPEMPTDDTDGNGGRMPGGEDFTPPEGWDGIIPEGAPAAMGAFDAANLTDKLPQTIANNTEDATTAENTAETRTVPQRMGSPGARPGEMATQNSISWPAVIAILAGCGLLLGGVLAVILLFRRRGSHKQIW